MLTQVKIQNENFTSEDTSDAIGIAHQELHEGKIPFILRRYLPNGDYEEWELGELDLLD
jgi:DNA-directed RNA polymerase I, II, and III subunit RPABC2